MEPLELQTRMIRIDFEAAICGTSAPLNVPRQFGEVAAE
jgi:hypothetical protein